MIHNSTLFDYEKSDNCKYCKSKQSVDFVLIDGEWKLFCSKCERISMNDYGGTGDAAECWENGKVKKWK